MAFLFLLNIYAEKNQWSQQMKSGLPASTSPPLWGLYLSFEVLARLGSRTTKSWLMYTSVLIKHDFDKSQVILNTHEI